MNCQEARLEIAGSTGNEELVEHLDSCPACARLQRELLLMEGELRFGSEVLLAQHGETGVTLTEARVVADTEKDGRPVVQLQKLDGRPVVSGDSGGGVWFNGRLAATIWTTIMMENTTTGVRRPTDMSVAAIFQPMP